MIEITEKQIEYKTDNYRIQVETNKNRTEIYIFDLNSNLITSFSSIKEAENIGRELLEVLDQLKI